MELVRKQAYGLSDTECPVMVTNVKINIFETFHVTSANVNKKNIATIFSNMTRSTNIITYLFSKIITVRGYAFLTTTVSFP